MKKKQGVIGIGVNTVTNFLRKDWERSKLLCNKIYNPIRRIPGRIKRAKQWIRKRRIVSKRNRTRWKHKHATQITYWVELVKIFPLYGFMITVMVWGITTPGLSFRFGIGATMLAYFIKVEIPYILRNILHR